MLSMSSSANALRSPLKTGAGLGFAALPVERRLRDMSGTQETGQAPEQTPRLQMLERTGCWWS